MLARANYVCVLALSRCYWRVLAVLLVRVDRAVLCRAVLSVLCYACGAKNAKKFRKASPTINILVGKYSTS